MPQSGPKAFFWHTVVKPRITDVVSNGAAMLKAMDDILAVADLPGPSEKMVLPVPNVNFTFGAS